MTHVRLDQVVRRHIGSVDGGGRAALSTRNGDVTFLDLEERAVLTARRLRAAGLQRGDRLLILMNNRVEWFDLLFACAKLGVVMVPANNFSVGEELTYIVEDAGASLVVSDPDLSPALDFLLGHEVLGSRLVLVGGERAGWTAIDEIDPGAVDPADVDEEVAPDDPFLLQYTSGTTGTPKAAVHTQSTLMYNTLLMVHEYALTEDDVYLLMVAMCWVAGFHFLTLATLLVGGRVAMYPDVNRIKPEELVRAWAKDRVTLGAVVPTLLRRLIDGGHLSSEMAGTLRLMITGSEPVPVDLLRAVHQALPRCEVVQSYGMSEAPASVLRLRGADAVARVGSVGRPSLLCEVRILDASGSVVSPGQVGEIVFRSPHTAQGYWNRPEQTAAAFRDGWFHSGDLATVDEDGFVFIVGRSKDMIISGGINIYPAEVERVLNGHPGVREAVVFGVPDPDWGETPVAVVVPDGEVSQEELAAYAAERLSKFKVPKRWHFRDAAFPRTASGKLQKFRVRDAIVDG
ncbi:class I adenylate-forming enzyme family protein [Georgenia sp. SYP-B2076]|uniref:class I adenylate-forming enzyme family protein n=1 Tax=Georgenia sp. SYP-B2076 TaxID=2495881 RepID=UPI000F8E90E0|nr:class I adenylate-forming enzyme family protein [Georgenia sp. SYP-B2076]